jgi:hypothetical protein
MELNLVLYNILILFFPLLNSIGSTTALLIEYGFSIESLIYFSILVLVAVIIGLL